MGIKGLDAWLTSEPEEGPCEMCGNAVDCCVCPECPVCETYGDPACYDSYYAEYRRWDRRQGITSHGMIETNEQIAASTEADRRQKEYLREEAKYWEKYQGDES